MPSVTRIYLKICTAIKLRENRLNDNHTLHQDAKAFYPCFAYILNNIIHKNYHNFLHLVITKQGWIESSFSCRYEAPRIFVTFFFYFSPSVNTQ